MEFNFVPDMPELTFSMFIAPYRAHLMGFYIVVTPPIIPEPLIALSVGSCSQLSSVVYIQETRLPPPPSPPPVKKNIVYYIDWNKCLEFLYILFLLFFLFFSFSFSFVRWDRLVSKQRYFDSTKINCVISIWILIN